MLNVYCSCSNFQKSKKIKRLSNSFRKRPVLFHTRTHLTHLESREDNKAKLGNEKLFYFIPVSKKLPLSPWSGCALHSSSLPKKADSVSSIYLDFCVQCSCPPQHLQTDNPIITHFKKGHRPFPKVSCLTASIFQSVEPDESARFLVERVEVNRFE